jgi:hypothetical protein
MRFGADGGVRKAKVVVRVALQVGDDAPDTAVQVAAAPSVVVPFLNCTVPVGLAPVPVPVTVAVRVTVPPEAIFMEELVTAVVVATPPELDPVKEKFRTVFPPNAIGLGSAWPNELTIM